MRLRARGGCAGVPGCSRKGRAPDDNLVDDVGKLFPRTCLGAVASMHGYEARWPDSREAISRGGGGGGGGSLADREICRANGRWSTLTCRDNERRGIRPIASIGPPRECHAGYDRDEQVCERMNRHTTSGKRSAETTLHKAADVPTGC